MEILFLSIWNGMILAQDVQIDCIRAAHKNAKSSDKKRMV